MIDRITVDFSAGCELHFGTSQLQLVSVVPTGSTLNDLVLLLHSSYAKEKPDGLLDPAHSGLRPGILALVNDTDCEVLGGFEYVLCDGDNVSLISTLHGG